MRKTITSLAAALLALNTSAQVTINASDVPVPPATINIMQYLPPSNLPSGSNQNWNVSSNTQMGPTTLQYSPETVPYWLSLGADVYRATTKKIATSFIYDIFTEFDKASTSFNEIGFNVPAQDYSLGSFTGNNNDSIFFPEQDIVYSTPKTLLSFPMTSTSNYSSSGRRVVSFTLNAPALGLNYTPCTHVLNEIRKDSVMGWGTMRVYMNGGATSQAYDVLMCRTTSYSLDSFYLAGSPAPAALLTAFGVTQGQKVNAANSINFYRKGHFTYLYRQFYGDDNTFSNMVDAYSHLDDLNFATGMSQHDMVKLSTIVYPMPASSADVHIQIIGANAADYQTCTILSNTGALLYEGSTTVRGNDIVLPTSTFAAGNYFVTLKSTRSGATITEQVIIK
ncbi:MAG: hypothetical protein RL660_1357 [Bacteroidota bacterium]|jgi:hypothetical protein